MMRRREFITLLGGAATWSVAARAQQPARRPLIGVLSPASTATAAGYMQGLRAGLRDFGYVEGHNIWLEVRYAEGVPARLSSLAAELVELKPDVIIAGSALGISAAQRVTQTIPLITFTVEDPVALGLAKSIARPGGNITGIATFGDDALVGKQLALLKEVVPDMSQLAVMVNPGDPGEAFVLRFMPEAARALGVTFHVFEVQAAAELEATFGRIVRDGMHALFMTQNPVFFSRRYEVAELAVRLRLPAMYGYREFVEAGGLLSYGSSLPGAYRQSARLIDKILKGANPSDLPFELATRFELAINLKTAKAIGLTITESFLARADEVIE
jgi:putative tryptophan/tyrosine transport system substrate-binding protein